MTTLKEKLEQLKKPYYNWRNENDNKRLLSYCPVQDLMIGLAEDAGYFIPANSLPLPDEFSKVHRGITALLLGENDDNSVYKF